MILIKLLLKALLKILTSLKAKSLSLKYALKGLKGSFQMIKSQGKNESTRNLIFSPMEIQVCLI